MKLSDDLVTTKELVTNLRRFNEWVTLPSGIVHYTCLVSATRLLELEKFVKIRDAYLVDRGLWEDFCKSVEEKENEG